MKLSTEIKHLSFTRNIVFIVSSLVLIIAWMFICAKIDRENDRGLLTSFGYCCIFPAILVSFFSNNKVADFFSLLIYLCVACLLVLLVGFTLGILLTVIAGPLGIAAPLLVTGFLMFYCIRLVISFPDNKTAFWVILVLPIIAAIILYALPANKSDLHEYGIGFPISIYLSLQIISIAVLCKLNNQELEKL
ncbi:hypothetical protein ACFSJW_22270 [Flavobacterium artemisiae]|uniref:Uncharacterized protein n=1 Tax=Flavobacterium artemisiae TaxID=2126556 RepID=A0ABW4H7I8_9FLAO